MERLLGCLVLLAATAVAAAAPPPAVLDFVPDFSFRTRVVSLDPAPDAGTANKTVLTVFNWGWGQTAGETVGVGEWGQECEFTRNVTGAYWAKGYPNTYLLRQALPGDDQDRKVESILATHLFVCHGGSFPNQTSGRDPNQTTTVEVEVTLDGSTTTLGATLKWGAEGASSPAHCDDLGIIVGQKTHTRKHFVETFQQYNARKYWPAFGALPTPLSSPTKFAIMDGFRTADCDLQATRDALRATKQLGLHGSQFGGSMVLGSIPGGSAWLQRDELGYALTAGGGSNVALLDYAPGAGNLTAWAHTVADPLLQLGFKGDEIRNTPIHDEPTMSIPRDFPPVGNPTFPEVTARWVSYLKGKGLTPAQLGATVWSDVKPDAAGYMPGSSLEAQRLYYHSVLFVSWDSSRYLAQATRSLESLLTPEATIFVNWNNMASHFYFPTAGGTGYISHDWFMHARERGTTQLWTEDWFGDGQSWQWSYYASLMSSATRLATPLGGTREFGGYVVPRSSLGHVDGALLRRVIALIGGGAKGLTYFLFGPDYEFVGNCYSDEPSLGAILAEEQQAHELIGRAEAVLWPARRLQSKVAIVAHRSSNVWDPICLGSCIQADQTEHAMTYTADQFGYYLALAIHGGMQVDFIDEDALLNATVMAAYTVVIVTEPNVPKAGIQQLAAWATAGGRLVLSGGAAMADEYNVTDETLSLLTGCSMSPFPRRLLPDSWPSHGAVPNHGPSPLPFVANGTVESATSGAKQHVTMYGDMNGFLKLRAEGSRTLGHFDSGGASAVDTAVGSAGGSIVQLAWMPGFSYLPNATRADYVPNPVTEFPATIRQFVQSLVADAAPSAVVLAYCGEAVVGVETVLMSSDVGAVVTVLNWGGVSLSATLSLTLNLTAAGFDAAGTQLGAVLDAASGKPINPTAPKDGAVTVSVTARHANFITFARTGVRSV